MKMQSGLHEAPKTALSPALMYLMYRGLSFVLQVHAAVSLAFFLSGMARQTGDIKMKQTETY